MVVAKHDAAHEELRAAVRRARGREGIHRARLGRGDGRPPHRRADRPRSVEPQEDVGRRVGAQCARSREAVTRIVARGALRPHADAGAGGDPHRPHPSDSRPPERDWPSHRRGRASGGVHRQRAGRHPARSRTWIAPFSTRGAPPRLRTPKVAARMEFREARCRRGSPEGASTTCARASTRSCTNHETPSTQVACCSVEIDDDGFPTAREHDVAIVRHAPSVVIDPDRWRRPRHHRQAVSGAARIGKSGSFRRAGWMRAKIGGRRRRGGSAKERSGSFPTGLERLGGLYRGARFLRRGELIFFRVLRISARRRPIRLTSRMRTKTSRRGRCRCAEVRCACWRAARSWI